MEEARTLLEAERATGRANRRAGRRRVAVGAQCYRFEGSLPLAIPLTDVPDGGCHPFGVGRNRHIADH